MKEMTEGERQKLQGYIRARVTVNPKTDCWDWHLAACGRGGYPLIPFRRKNRRGPRLAYLAFVGEMPEGTEDIHHICLNRKCLNPAHLEPMPHGPHMTLHGELGSWDGEKNGRAKLTEKEVQAIRIMAEAGLPVADLARSRGISLKQGYNLRNFVSWKRLPQPDVSQVTLPSWEKVSTLKLKCLFLNMLYEARGEEAPPDVNLTLALIDEYESLIS